MNCLSLFLGIAACLFGSTVAQNALGAYETSTEISMEWKVDSASFLDTEDIFQLEQGTSQYFSDLILDPSHSGFPPPNELLSVTTAVKRQDSDSNDTLTVDALLTTVHIGNQGIFDLGALLTFLTNRKGNNSDSSFDEFESVVGLDMELEFMSFSNVQASELLTKISSSEVDQEASKYSKSEKSLIVVTSVLAIALFVLSVILIWIAGGWLALRKQVQILLHREEELTRMTHNIKSRPTEDTDDENPSPTGETKMTNPSGILGVNPYFGKSGSALDGLGIKMTPARRTSRDLDSEVFTPMSEAATEYSDSGRAPIGITSMRKLIPGAGALEMDPNVDPLGMKKLEY